MSTRRSARGWIVGAIVVIVVVALAAWWYFSRMPGVDMARHGPAPSEPASTSTAPLAITHPIEQAQAGPASASTAPLPTLEDSDNPAARALAALPGAQGLAELLITRGLIPHIVATVDALPRQSIGSSVLPMHTPGGEFEVETDDGQVRLDAGNFARYAPYMKIVDAVDPRTLVDWYVRWYPLFQQAYRELGYPRGYFNDRVIAAIDNMLAAPNARGAIALVKTRNDHYAFADPTWEALSVGQKLMIRVGPENERTLKAKLRSIRALLLGNAPGLPPPAMAGTAAPASS